jgi:hypothetical protein
MSKKISKNKYKYIPTYENLLKKRKKNDKKQKENIARRNRNTLRFNDAAKDKTVSSYSSKGSSSSKSSNPDRNELLYPHMSYGMYTRKGGKRKNRRTKRRSYRSK